MRTYKVKLNSIEKVKRFANIISLTDTRAELIHKSIVVNACSILGIFSLDLSQTLDLKLEKDVLPEELEQFLVQDKKLS